MNNRYLHMFSWGLLYSLFSLTVVVVYKVFDSNKGIVSLKLKKNKGIKFHTSDILAYFILTITSAIRLNTGSDYYNYYNYYNNIKISYNSPREIISNSQFGYFLLSWIIKSITNYEYAIFIVIAIFSYSHLFYTLRKENIPDMSCALLCYMFLGYYAYSNNILKQYIAMAFVMSAHINFKNKNLIKFSIFSILAVIFHYSALFAIVIIVIARKFKPTFSKFYLAIVSGITIGLSLNSILYIITNTISSASGYAKYIQWRRNNQLRLVLAVFGMFLVYTIIVYFILKNKDKILDINKSRYEEIIFLIVGLGINAIALRQWIISRIAIYFYQFIILILPTMFSGMSKKKKSKIKLFLYIMMFVYMIFSSIFLGENEYYSYNTIFSGDPVMSDVQYNALHGWYKKR